MSKTVWTWGRCIRGSLGNNDKTFSLGAESSPVSMVGGFTDWSALGTKNYWSGSRVLIRENGTLWSVGQNNGGQLGDGTTAYRSSPVSVLGGFTDWSDVALGATHVVALRENGTVWCWGNGNLGKLGVYSYGASSPVSVLGGFTDWASIGAGISHSLGVRSNGTLWAWGEGGDGPLGDGTTASRSSPVSVIGGFTDWVFATGLGDKTFGVRSDGTLWAWGDNIAGSLGINHRSDKRSSPVSVVGIHSGWDMGRDHITGANGSTIGIRDGVMWSWGAGTSGQLGNGSRINRSSPVSVTGGFTDWVDAASAGATVIAQRENSSIWTWGSSAYGLLLDGGTRRSSPVQVFVGVGNIESLSANRASGTQWFSVLASEYPDYGPIDDPNYIDYECDPIPEEGCPEPPPDYIPIDRYPLIVDKDDMELKEIPPGSNLDMGGSSIVNVDFINGEEVSTLSDISLKADVSTIQNALQIVEALRGVTFNWKETHKEGIGLIAQEVESVIPEVVYSSKHGKSIAYGNIVAVLIEAIKENSRAIEDLLNTKDN